MRKWAYGVTAAVLIPGLLFLAVKGFDYSIEFTGGTMVQVAAAPTTEAGTLRAGARRRRASRAPRSSSSVRPGNFVIRARVGEGQGSTEATAEAVKAALNTTLGEGKYTLGRAAAVSPKVGGELRTQALLAVLTSFIFVLIYLAVRFEWRFGLAAIIATAHDILATLAFIAVMRLEVSLVVVAALLTMVGYSLNDTIIIFDRVRENLKKYQRSGFVEILNRSINETLPRSVLTHLTTLATLLALAIFGGEVIRPFSLVMFFGVFTGTFSSVFIAAPVLLWIEHKWPGPAARGAKVSGRWPGAAGGASGQGDGLIDTHCHLASEAYDADRDQVLQRAWEAGVQHIVVIGESPVAAAAALELAGTDPRLSATAGVHPHDAKDWSPQSADWLARALADPRVVAAGEMGLDYHYDHSPRDAQHAAFRAQLAIAADAARPVIIHAREADDDVAAILRSDARTPVVLHSFSSGPALLRAGLDLGHYLSFSGMVTFRNWALDDAIRAVPLERLLIETDGPYLAPIPHRGKRNEPAFVRYTAERIAAVRGIDAAELIAATTRNAVALFGSQLSGR